MAKKVALEYTAVQKFIVNQGQPNEAQYDYISAPYWLGDDTDNYYVVRKQGREGVVDADGTVVFPFWYPKIRSFASDNQGRHFVICQEPNDQMLVSPLANPQLRSPSYFKIEAIKNRAGDLFFRAETLDPYWRYNLFRFIESPIRFNVHFLFTIEHSQTKIELDHMYNLVTLKLDEGSTDVIIDSEGIIVYKAPGNRLACEIGRFDGAENAFVVAHKSELGRINAMKLLVIVPDGDKSQILTKNAPSSLFEYLLMSDQWAKFMNEEVEFSDQIIR